MMGNMWGVMRQAGPTIGDFAARGPSEHTSLVLDVHPGQRATGQLWLKNHSSAVVNRIEFRSTALESADGARLAPEQVSFTPAVVDNVQPGATIRVDVTVAMPEVAAPGVYHGVALAKQLPDLCRPLQVRCRGTAEGSDG